jgi:hypothetical protein
MSYADPDIVTVMCNTLKPTENNDSSKFDALLLIAIDDAEDTINTSLFAGNVPIPTIPDTIDKLDPLNTLLKAANLYATAFMEKTYQTDTENLSPTYVENMKMADKKVANYIEIILEGYNEKDQKEEVDIPPFSALI